MVQSLAMDNDRLFPSDPERNFYSEPDEVTSTDTFDALVQQYGPSIDAASLQPAVLTNANSFYKVS